MDNEELSKMSKASPILLPIITLLNIAISICYFVIKDFKVGLQPLVLWIYFSIIILYSGLSIFDVFYRKDKNKKYILLMSIVTIISDISFITCFYL